MTRLRIAAVTVALLAITSIAIACGGDDEKDKDGTSNTSPTQTTRPTEGGGGEAVDLEIAAENTAYDVPKLTAPAGADVTLVFDNDDEGLQHNWSLYEDKEATKEIFEGDILTGVDTINYEFKAPDKPGTYYFHCDIHPTVMKGEFIVE